MTTIKKAMLRQEAKLIMPADIRLMDMGLMPDSGTLVCTMDDSCIYFIDSFLAVAAKKHNGVDSCADPLELFKVHGLPGGKFLAISLEYVKLFAAKGKNLAEEASWHLLSEHSIYNSLGLSADLKGKVKAVCELEYLHLLQEDGTKKTLHDPGNYFWGVAVSPDGEGVAVGRKDGTVETRNPRNLEITGRYKGLTDVVLALAFSPDGKYLVAGDDRAKCVLWDLQTGKAVSIPGWSKIIGLFWMSDASGFIAVCLSRDINFIALEDLNGADPQEYYPPYFRLDQYSPQYIQSSLLRDDANLFVFVEKKGVVHIKLG